MTTNCLLMKPTMGCYGVIGLLWLALAGAVISLPAEDETLSPNTVNFKTLVRLNLTDGANPEGSTMTQGTDGNLYGVNVNGGANGAGNVFKMTPNGSLTVLYDFCSATNCADGAYPLGPLVLGVDGNLYGTTVGDGITIWDTVFKISPSGTLTTIYSFSGTDGNGPFGILLGADGNFYGTTIHGGINGEGTVFKLTPEGALTTLYSFCSEPNCGDGSGPVAPVIQATDGNFYGTAQLGGAYGNGTVFKITSKGVLTTLHSFCAQPNCIDGAVPGGPSCPGFEREALRDSPGRPQL